MKKIYYLLIVLLFGGCTTGKKAYERGDYFGAVHSAVDRLRSNPSHSKTANVLESSYPMALKWAQDEIDFQLSSNQPGKWDKTLDIMLRVNALAQTIRQSPAALSIIPSPKVYTSELTSVREKAADENYNAGLTLLEQQTREAARQAYYAFSKSNNLIPGYRESLTMMAEARALATVSVVVEPFPVHAAMFSLTADFFYNQVFEYLHNRFPEQGFVKFYAPENFAQSGVKNPDMVLRLEFYDFVVGNTLRTESEKEVSRTVKVTTKDSLRTPTITYRAKLKVFTEKVASGGVVDLKIVDYPSGNLMVNDRIPGEFIWSNAFALFVGDEQALTDDEYKLTRHKSLPAPPPQALFVEFTKPIYSRLTSRIYNYFSKYN